MKNPEVMNLSKVRIYELAKELGMSNKDMLTKLHEQGVDAHTHMSSLDDGDVQKIRNAVKGQGAKSASAPKAAPAAEKPAPAAVKPVAPVTPAAEKPAVSAAEQSGERPAPRPQGDRPQGQGYQGSRPQGQGYQGNRPQGQGYQGNRPQGDRPQGISTAR